MHAQSQQLDVIAQNLANASTAGYKPRRYLQTSFGGDLRAAIGGTDAQGPLRQTGVATDLALVGRGYFTISTPEGIRYTRDGRMSTDGHGHLCDARGNPVLGSAGALRLPHGARITQSGDVVADGRVIDRLRIADFAQPPSGEGGGAAAQGDDAGAPPAARGARATVRSGYLEESGVEPIAEMTALIAAQRAYEANQKSAQRADESLRRAVTDVPAVRS
jgi:flagellar basal-body rod protein FlgG